MGILIRGIILLYLSKNVYYYNNLLIRASIT